MIKYKALLEHEEVKIPHLHISPEPIGVGEKCKCDICNKLNLRETHVLSFCNSLECKCLFIITSIFFKLHSLHKN